MCIELYVNNMLLLSDFNVNLNCIDRFSINRQIQNFAKIYRVRAELFHADRQTYMTELIVTLPNFANGRGIRNTT